MAVNDQRKPMVHVNKMVTGVGRLAVNGTKVLVPKSKLRMNHKCWFADGI